MEEVTVCSGRSTIWHSKRKFQVHLSLTKETASVDEVQMMLEQQLGFNVILLDAKHLPVMSRETTKGLFSVKYKKKPIIMQITKYQLKIIKKYHSFLLNLSKSAPPKLIPKTSSNHRLESAGLIGL